MDTQDEPRGRLSKQQADQMVVDVVGEHAESLLRTARRYSVCQDDAQDAYQRALEVFVKRAATLDPDRVVGWVHTVVRHEAFAVKAKRADVSLVDMDFDREEARHDASPEERVLDHERIAHTAEALRGLKPQEVQALWHQALGKTYAQIAEDLAWSHTKVNRCLVEGRQALASRFARIESGAECERWTPALSAMLDGEATAEQRAALRPHLRNCAGCRATLRELDLQTKAVAAILPPIALSGGDGPLPDAPGVLTRLYETAVTFLGERAALGAVKLQAAGDLVGGTKVAAVAASAAAMAGGGAVVAEQVDRPPQERRTAAAARPVSALAPVPAALREARKVTLARPAPVRTPVRRTRSRKAARSSGGPAREFGGASRPTAAAAEFGAGRATTSSTTSTTSTAGSPAGTSRSFESGATAPPRRLTQPPARSQSGAEFGF